MVLAGNGLGDEARAPDDRHSKKSQIRFETQFILLSW
jgi:hypothetical protein